MPDLLPSLQTWKALLRDHPEHGVAPEDFFRGCTDRDERTLAALAVDPGIRERSFRRGAVLCAAGGERFTALLLWRGRILGLYGHRVALRGLENIVRDLKEFRLGWLPDEVVRQTGGYCSAFAVLPPEAEGFPVTCVAGPQAGLFAAYGKIYETGYDAVAE